MDEPRKPETEKQEESQDEIRDLPLTDEDAEDVVGGLTDSDPDDDPRLP